MRCIKHPSYEGTNPPQDSCTPCRRIYALTHCETKTRDQIARDLGTSVRWVYTQLAGTKTTKKPHPETKSEPPADEEFKHFLIKGRTLKELQDKFGDKVEALLSVTYDGLTLFTQRNNYHELVYILLPKPPEGIKLLPKEFEYHIGHDENGEEQPYLLVKLPDFKKKVIIAPLFDVHYGSAAHKHEKFLGYLRWIAETPNVYVILGGDIMENALDDGRGMTYDQSVNPQNQLDRLTVLLAPIAHKILVSVPGNHEARTEKKTGIDVAAALADRLKIPYFSGPVTMSIVANTYKWTFYVFHGFGNSQTKGGKANMAARPKGWTGLVHFFVSGHVHDCIVSSELVLIEDPLNCRLLEVKQWVVVAQSFLKWYKTYAYRAGYKPPAAGGVSMELFADGNYRAHLTD